MVRRRRVRDVRTAQRDQTNPFRTVINSCGIGNCLRAVRRLPSIVGLVGEGVRRTSGAVVVGEVRSGAYGIIAAQAAAVAPPDGYTLTSAIMGMMSVLPAIPNARMALDVDRDLTPVTNLAGSAMAV